MTAGVIPSAEVAAVAGYVTARTGLSFAGARRVTMLQQVSAAMARAGARTSDAYRSVLEHDAEEFDALIARVTVAESYFFREPRQLDTLRRLILPERRRARGPTAGLRLWSAGCATGQEVYTLAIILEQEGALEQSRVLGTDISIDALRVARAGVYTKWSLRAVDERQQEQYFRRVPGGFRIDDRFDRTAEFRQLNLLDDTEPVPSNIDVVLCRNVLIYFSAAAIGRAAARLAASLVPGGWLITGPSDPPLTGVDGLEPTRTHAGVVYRRTPAGAVAERASGRLTVARERRGAPPPPRPAAPPAARRVARPSAREPVHNDGACSDSADQAAAVVRSLGGAGDLAGAIDAASRAISRFPLHSELRFLHAVALLESGRPAESASAARAALYLDADLIMAHLALARAESALGRPDRARRSMRTAADLLDALPPDGTVPFSDGESAGRLAAMVAAQSHASDTTTRGTR